MKTPTPLRALPILLLTALPAAAQLRESVAVEGNYLKDIIRAERINRLPELEAYPMATTPLDYATAGVAADFTPESPLLPATAYGASRDSSRRRGYIDLAMGSYLNTSLSAGYGAIDSPDTRLGIRLGHYSTSLWHPWGADFEAAKNYQEMLGLDFTRRFAGLGTLSASAQYHLGYFNYYGIMPEREDHAIVLTEPRPFPTQTLNDAAVRVGWTSMPDATGLRWHAALGARHFAYRTATRETSLMLDGGMSAAAGANGTVGFDGHLEALFYGTHPTVPETYAPDSYANILLTPYYLFRRNALTLRAGFDLDLTFNADGDEAGSHFGAVHVAPDIRLDIAARNFGFYIHILGGTSLRTLAAISQTDPYCNPALQSTRPVNSPIDARIGIETTPFAGFSASIEGRYGAWRGVGADGWYAAILNYGAATMPGLDLPAGTVADYGLGYTRYNLSGFSASARLAYKPNHIVSLAAEGTYTPQHGTTGVLNGLDRPRWIAGVSAEIHPVRPLGISVSYEYRGVRNVYTTYDASGVTLPMPGGTPPQPADNPGLAALRLPDITRLGAAIEWSVTSGLTLGVTADNLLGTPVWSLPCLPGQGRTFAGRLSWVF
ncbi:MAG: hypothetical protein HDR80_10180 [Bacteroides sp.]|nr:hypothetical protein [Bacteroides sp.]MBD5371488.1 hypothetical protein [Bacteroides sp.]